MRDDDVAALKKLERHDVMRRDEKASAVIRRVPRERLPGVLTVPFSELPMHPPGRWSEAETEVDLFDPAAMAKRWNKASGFAFLTTPEISEDGTEAATVATLLLPEDQFIVRVYWLVKEDGRWIIKSLIDIGAASPAMASDL